MSSNVLGARDTNTQVKPVASSTEKTTEKPSVKSLEFHRQVLHSRMNDNEQEPKFVSPSDDIMSPATQKLQAFKTKHFVKKSKPQLLFKKTTAKSFVPMKDNSSGSAAPPLLFADIPCKVVVDAKAEEEGTDTA